MERGTRNLITDVPGLRVGNAQDAGLRSGATVLLADQPAKASAHVMGGAPGTRETDLLAPDKLVQEVDAIVLSGGSALGLSAASGVADALRAEGRGYAVGDQRVPIVPSAIVQDLTNGGDKSWAENPYPALGRQALAAAALDFDIGSHGAGFCTLTAGLKGGLGSASLRLPNGITVGALAVVNAWGSVVVGDGPQFWAAPFEIGAEFGGLGPAPNGVAPDYLPQKYPDPVGNTTLGIVATDASLDKAALKRMAVAAHDGMARAIVPSHTPVDGDIVFALSTSGITLTSPRDPLTLGHVAATVLARAIARAVYAATPAPGDPFPTWGERFSPADPPSWGSPGRRGRR